MPPSLITTTLDLHGIRHSEVRDRVQNFVLAQQEHMPLEIIYGNSTTMRKLVEETLNSLGLKYNSGYQNQYGRLLILSWRNS